MKSKLLLGIIGGPAILASAVLGSAGVANASICYAYDNQMSCSVSSPHGIKSIFISLDTADGVLPVVNEVYDCVPQTGFSYEMLGPVHHWEIEECLPDPGVSPQPDLPLKAKPLPGRGPSIDLETTKLRR